MNNDTVSGKFDQIKGKVKQSVGEAVGDDRMANSGTADQVKGNAKEAWGTTKDAAHRATDNAAAGTSSDPYVKETRSTTGSNTAHDVREKIVSTARNAKEAITGEAHDRTGKRSA